MKKIPLLVLGLSLLVLSACGSQRNTPPAAAQTPAPTAAPAPDFSDADFSGRWSVSEIIDSHGLPVTDAEKQDLDADFTLELLPGGAYFVYDEDGRVLGQGDYSVTLDRLTLTAQGEKTVYTIVDENTVRITQPDASVTVMKRGTHGDSSDLG